VHCQQSVLLCLLYANLAAMHSVFFKFQAFFTSLYFLAPFGIITNDKSEWGHA